jgi:F-type H+-transporting ATPase subunit epsilon
MIALEIVTPERRLFKIQCEAATLPGLDGEFEVLEGHTPLLAAIKTGILSIKKPERIEAAGENFDFAGSDNYRVMIADGFVEVNAHQVTVICEGAALASEVNTESERALIQHIHDKMKLLSAKDEKEFKVAQAEIERATAKLSLM